MGGDRVSRRDYIVSGTRSALSEWDQAVIRAVLVEYGVDDSEPRDVLHHGGCPTGVDAFVDQLADQWPLTVKPHPADWELGRRAGPIRNRAMIALAQPDMCFAFPRRGLPNRGTMDFIKACLEAQVDVQVVWLERLTQVPKE